MTSLRPRLRLLPLAMLLALSVPAQAQSLLALYEAARGYDGSWQSAKAQYDANLFRAEQAKAGILPTANLAAGVSRTQFENTNPATDRGFDAQSATLSASQPLYRPANFATYEQGKRQVEQALAQLTSASQDLAVRVSQAYFDVLAAYDTLTFVKALKAATAEQLASAKRNFEVGTATITDTREAQARYDLNDAQEIAALNDLRIKRLILDNVVGITDAVPLQLALPLALPLPEPADMNAWVLMGETRCPAVQLARSNLEIAQLETEKAKAGHKPTLDLTASYNVLRNANGSTTTILNQRLNTGQVGVAFNLPLFAGFATQNRIRETLSLEEKAQADLEVARRGMTQTTKAAYLSVVSGQGQVRALEAAEASSQSALDANRVGYQVGIRINIDVLNSQSQLYQTKRDLAQARYNVLLATLKLRQANGTLVADDLARLNQLLVPR